ncbi:hypothetical protein [Butyrivibrio sp. AE3004]|uniref:hypothetical protein n=1 Tax=Butyrivibrio sp. AE3004 TaxID=1506994 RepID=UPI000493DC24|nr:hypothetical protein [Butyrivibrio sp. AE3004]
MKKDRIGGIIKGMLFAFAAVAVFAEGSMDAKAGNLANAGDISNGQAVQGTITESDKEMYYKYTASGSGYVNFSVSPSALTTDEPRWEIDLYDADASEITDCHGTKPVTNNVMVHAGSSYFVKITNWSSARDVAYTIKANYVPYEYVVTEPNNGASNAKQVAFNSEYLGVIDNSRDEDFFKITAPKAGDVNIDFKRYQITSTEMPEWDFTLYDSSMNRLYSINSKFQDDVHNTEGVHYVLDANKSIYVKINKSNSNAIGELYSFKASFSQNKFVEKESNNDFNKATNIQLKKSYLGVMGEDNTGDYFRLKTKGSGKYKVNLKLDKAVKYGYSIKIYDSSRNLVASTQKKIYKNGSLKFRAKKKKKYYVVVEHADKGFLSGGICVGTVYRLKVGK